MDKKDAAKLVKLACQRVSRDLELENDINPRSLLDSSVDEGRGVVIVILGDHRKFVFRIDEFFEEKPVVAQVDKPPETTLPKTHAPDKA